MYGFNNAVAVFALCSLWILPAFSQVEIDPNLPEYKVVQGISGSIKSVGSDTMNNLMALWSEGFQNYYPNVKVEIEGKGSSTAPPALIAGTANFGPMSRTMKEAEMDEFEKKFGYKPVQLPTCLDVVVVYVNKDNPIKGLSLPQVDAIFSKNRLGGYPTEITNWGQLGLKGIWEDLPISIYGRNSASGTYGYFKNHALYQGDFKDSVKEQPGSSTVVQGIASDKGGIGYSGVGYMTADVRAVPLSIDESGDYKEPVVANAYTGKYPLSRFLWLSVNYKPGSQLDPLRREFVKYILSKEGQMNVIRDGYFPLSAELAKDALRMVGIH